MAKVALEKDSEEKLLKAIEPERGAPRPESIVIGGHTWSVEFLNETEMRNKMPGDENIVGLTFRQTQQIFMADWINESLVRERFLHEVIHACVSFVAADGIEYTDNTDHEEMFISMIDGPLYITLRDNPEVMDWLFGGQW